MPKIGGNKKGKVKWLFSLEETRVTMHYPTKSISMSERLHLAANNSNAKMGEKGCQQAVYSLYNYLEIH